MKACPPRAATSLLRHSRSDKENQEERNWWWLGCYSSSLAEAVGESELLLAASLIKGSFLSASSSLALYYIVDPSLDSRFSGPLEKEGKRKSSVNSMKPASK